MMISIKPVALDDLTAPPEVMSVIAKVCSAAKRRDAQRDDDPFVQLSYDDIGIDSVEALFTYAGIASVNLPVGAPCEFEVAGQGTDWIVFPLRRLEESIAAMQPGDIENVGSDVLNDILNCIRFCLAHNLLLVIRW